MFHVYILQNPQGRFYIGQTQNLDARLADHNRTDSVDGKYTRKNGPWSLLWSESHATRAEAMRREKEIKGWKSAERIRRELLKWQSPAPRD